MNLSARCKHAARVYIASKNVKLMKGIRNGLAVHLVTKGVVSLIMPEEDIAIMPDGHQ